VSALWGSPMEQPRRAFAILVIGVALNALAFTLSLPVFLWGQFQAGTPLDLLWMLGMLAIGVSAGTWIEDRRSAPRRLFSRDVVELSRLALPAMTAAFAAGLVVVANLSNSGVERLAGISLAAVETRDMVVAPHYADHPKSTKPLHATIASAIAVPLIAHGELVGTLAMYSATPRRFSSDTQRLVRLYAAQ